MKWTIPAFAAVIAIASLSVPAEAAPKKPVQTKSAPAPKKPVARPQRPVVKQAPRTQRPPVVRQAPRSKPPVVRQIPRSQKPPVVRTMPNTPRSPRIPNNTPVQSQRPPVASPQAPRSDSQARPQLPPRTAPSRDGGFAGPNSAPRVLNQKDGGFAGPKLPARTTPSLPATNVGKLAPQIQIGKANGRNYSLIRGPRFIFRNGMLRRLALLSAIPPLLYLGEEYTPYGYVALPRPVCEGITEDGCRLSWESVPVDNGPDEVQCMQFCRRNYVPREITLSEPLPVVQAGPGCELAVYAAPSFAEPAWPVNADQPDLGDWDKRIESVRIVSGTWDFFTEKNYGGETMRLGKGEQADLGPDWKDQVSSMMCTQQ